MKKTENGKLFVAAAFIAAFVLWTVLVRIVDVRAVGPEGTSVGFAGVNLAVHKFFGVNMALYTVTDWLSLIPIGFAAGFGILGSIQLIKRKHILRVDKSLIVLGVFYVLVMAVYLFFEFVVINYRPILIEGRLEASYPSSTTMLVTCIMPTAIMQLNSRIKNRCIRYMSVASVTAFTLFMVIARFMSGVHWASDIIGGILISVGLVSLYAWGKGLFEKK